jgi:hypothetical protein
MKNDAPVTAKITMKCLGCGERLNPFVRARLMANGYTSGFCRKCESGAGR